MQNKQITPENDIVINNFLDGVAKNPEIKSMKYRLDMASEYIKTFYDDFNIPEHHILKLFNFISDGGKAFSKQNRQQEKIKQATELLEKGCKEFFTSEKYMQYLDLMTTFNNYSPRNVLLILMQRPESTIITSAADWKNKYNRYINKGEKAIMIYAPLLKSEKVLINKKDPVTGEIILGENGLPIQEETGRVKKTIVGFTTVPVFDVSQTNGAELPKLGNNLTADVENFDVLRKAIEAISPCPINYSADLANDSVGYYSIKDNEIFINSGISQLQMLDVLIHEEAHAFLHKDGSDKSTKEIQAESIAYVVGKSLGLDTSAASFEYIASWSQDKNVKELMQSMELITKQSKTMLKEIINEMDKINNVMLETAKDYITKYAAVEHLGAVDFSDLRKVDLAFTEIETSNNNVLPIQISADLLNFNINVYSADKLIHQRTYDTLETMNNDLRVMTFDNLVDSAESIINNIHTSTVINYKIYQLDSDDRNLRFASYNFVKKVGKNVNLKNYKEVYSDSIEAGNSDIVDVLEKLYDKFNLYRPEDFKGHSLSVSDIIAIEKEDNKETFYYVDDLGFKDVTNDIEFAYILNNLPDNTITIKDRDEYGYTDNHLIPLKKDKALELFDKDLCPIYRLYEDNTEGMVNTRSEIESFSGIFGVEITDWKKHLDSLKSVEDSIEQNDNNFDGIINNLPTEPNDETLRQVVTNKVITQEIYNDLLIPIQEDEKAIINLKNRAINDVIFDDMLKEQSAITLPRLLFYLEGAKITNCKFKDSVVLKNLENAHIKDCVFDGNLFDSTNLSNANLDNVTFINVAFHGCTFYEAQLKNCTFNNCIFETNDFLMSTFDGVNLNECIVAPDQLNVMTICSKGNKDNVLSILMGSEFKSNEPERETNSFKSIVAKAETKLVEEATQQSKTKDRDIEL